MTRPVTAREENGCFIDETVPDLDGVLPSSVDATKFVDWLAPKLGDYRWGITVRAQRDAPAQELAKLKRAAELVEGARAAVGVLPLRSSAALQGFCHAHIKQVGSEWTALEKRLNDDLLTAGILLRKAAGEFAKAKFNARGKPKNSAGDKLLAEVIAQLRLAGLRVEGVDGAQETASRILTACGVTTPTDPDRIKVAARRGRKLAG